MLTSYYTDDMVMDAIEAGAEGYLLKELNADLLVRSIFEVMEGKSILDPAVTRKVIDRARGQNRRKQGDIGVELKLSDKTVKNYLSNLMEKLNSSRRSKAAAFYVLQQHQPNALAYQGHKTLNAEKLLNPLIVRGFFIGYLVDSELEARLWTVACYVGCRSV